MTFLNGMDNMLDDALQLASLQLPPNQASAILGYNPTNGWGADLLEGAADWLGGTTRIAQQVAVQLLRLQVTGQAHTFVDHSQGGLIFLSAVSLLNSVGGGAWQLPNVSVVFNGVPANDRAATSILATAGITNVQINGNPGDLVYNFIGMNAGSLSAVGQSLAGILSLSCGIGCSPHSSYRWHP